MEILQSEQSYCNQLQFVINRVLIPSKALITDPEMHSLLFSNLEDLYQLHSSFL